MAARPAIPADAKPACPHAAVRYAGDRHGHLRYRLLCGDDARPQSSPAPAPNGSAALQAAFDFGATVLLAYPLLLWASIAFRRSFPAQRECPHFVQPPLTAH